MPAHNIIRIDEVEKEGIAKITSAEGNVKNFPSGNFTIPPNSNNTEK